MSDEVLSVNDIVTRHAQPVEEVSTQGNNNQETEQQQAAAKDQNSQQQENNESVPRETSGFTPEEISELGFTNLDEMKAFFKKQKEESVTLSPEEQQKRDNLYKAGLQQYAVENGHLTMDDFEKLSSFKQKADRDIVFESFIDEYKKDNPQASDKDVKAAFEEEYPQLDEEDEDNGEKNKARNEKVAKRLAKEAKIIKSPLEGSYANVKTGFDEYQTSKELYPKYNKEIASLVNGALPEKFEFFKGKDGEEDITLDLELSKEDKKQIADEIQKAIENPETFLMYKNGKVDDIKKLVNDKVHSYLWSEKYRSQALTKMASTFLERGKKKGSDIGAINPFPITNQQRNVAGNTNTDAAQTVLNSLEGKK